MTILAIDTSTEILSVALRSGSRTLAAYRDAGLRHTPVLMRLVDSLLAEAGVSPSGIDLIATMRGPGSFTGLRIGMATAKGLAAAIAARREDGVAPLVSVPTFDAMAAGLPPAGSIVLPVIDGRKGRFYSACFVGSPGGLRRVTSDLDLPPDELVQTARRAAAASGLNGAPIVVTGPHARELAAAAEDVTADPGARRAWALCLLDAASAWCDAHGYDPPGMGPHYVRASDAEIYSQGT